MKFSTGIRHKTVKRGMYFAAIIVFLYWLPTILTTASLFYLKGWQDNAQKSAEAIAGGQPYCIVLPIKNVGELVLNSFTQLDIEYVIKKEIKRKLSHLDFSMGKNSGPSGKLRVRDHHFGILVGKRLYYWSFTEQAFFDAITHAYAETTYNNFVFMRQYLSPENMKKPHHKQWMDRWIQIIRNTPPGYKPEDFLCPHV